MRNGDRLPIRHAPERHCAAAAVAELRQRLLPSAEPVSFDRILKHSENITVLFERANNDLTRRQKADLGKVLYRVNNAAAALGVQWIGS